MPSLMSKHTREEDFTWNLPHDFKRLPGTWKYLTPGNNVPNIYSKESKQTRKISNGEKYIVLPVRQV